MPKKAKRRPLRSLEELGEAPGHEGAKKPALIDRRLDERSRTKKRFERQNRDRPFTATDLGRAFFARSPLLKKLADYIEKDAPKPPLKLRKLIRLVDSELLALVAVDALINRIVAGWDWHDESCLMKLIKEIGQDLRDEIEMASQRAPDRAKVMAADNRHRALSPHRTLDWSNDVLLEAGGWLYDCALECTMFEEEKRKIKRNWLWLPKIADGHWAAIEELRKDLSLRHPYYLPHLKPPPDWTSLRTEYGPDGLPATFVRDEHPDTVAAIEAAFANGQLKPHASAVSNVQRVPWMINEFMLPVVEKLAPHVERRFKTAAGDDAECLKEALREDMELARHLAGRPFWTPYNIDFRGRLNPLPHFNIGREDRVRSLFLFANGPFGTVEKWRGFKDPFQFVAACRELVQAQNNPYFVTQLPVFLDGTSNGVQHLACMSRDEVSGKLVNLMDLDERYDIYGVITENVKKRLRAAGDKYAKWWLSPGVNGERLTRALIKRPVMTFSYGVTRYGIRGQIVEAYKEEHWDHEPQRCHVNYLAGVIFEVFEAPEGMVKRPHDVMEFIRRLAELQAERNRPLKWDTPSGLPVSSNRCYEPNTKRVELKLRRRRVTLKVAVGRKDKIIVADAINDAPANFVHSVDAAHLALSVNRAAEEDIVDVAVVHDCFAALAPQVQRFQQIIRIQMEIMHHAPVLARLRAGCEPVPASLAIPEMGNLKLSEIPNAEYSFT
jgi:DNA-directed RNA polymerase